MRRISWLACAIVMGMVWPSLANAMERQPNIVFIISDDHRWDCIGAAGNPLVHTPAIDRMAREGVHFREGTVTIPQCSPMRAQLMTGRLPHQNGWWSNQTQREDAKGPNGLKGPFLPEVLREAGYQTVLVGKWHLDIEPWESGFEQVRVWLPGGSSPYRDTELAHGNSRKREPVKGYTNVLFGDDAVEFIKKDAAEDKPFFLWLALTAPHTPLRPNPPHIQKLYEGKETPDLLPPGFPTGIKTGNFKNYYEAISLADEITGNVIAALEQRGMLENSVVVFLGDNGFMMGSKGIGAGTAGKVVPWDESVRVPFLVLAPGITKFTGTSSAAVTSSDLPPTFAKLAGAQVPSEWIGRDIRPALEKKDGHGIDEAFIEFPDNQSDRFGHLAYRQIRTPTHKLIVWEDAKRKPGLYDLQADPREEKNLYGDASVADVQKHLHERLKAWMEKTDDPLLAVVR